MLRISMLWGPILFKEGVLGLLKGNGKITEFNKNKSKISNLEKEFSFLMVIYFEKQPLISYT